MPTIKLAQLTGIKNFLKNETLLEKTKIKT